MKSIIIVFILIAGINIKLNADDQNGEPLWINPDNILCNNHKGKINNDGVCEATWYNARKICHASEGRLPTIDELKKVVLNCGGETGFQNEINWKKNTGNANYQSCYKKKGFTSNYYFSDTDYISNFKSAYILGFYRGYQTTSMKDYVPFSVRCISMKIQN